MGPSQIPRTLQAAPPPVTGSDGPKTQQEVAVEPGEGAYWYLPGGVRGQKVRPLAPVCIEEKDPRARVWSPVRTPAPD